MSHQLGNVSSCMLNRLQALDILMNIFVSSNTLGADSLVNDKKKRERKGKIDRCQFYRRLANNSYVYNIGK